MKTLFMVAVGLIVLACSTEATDSQGLDSSAQIACRDFARLVINVRDGVSTAAEIRSDVQRFERTARSSKTPGVAESARRLLAAITSGDSNAISAATSSLTSACRIGQ